MAQKHKPTFGNQGNLFMALFKVGDRVQPAPHTDHFMQGDRYGTVALVGKIYIHVDMDKSGRRRRFHPENLMLVLKEDKQ